MTVDRLTSPESDTGVQSASASIVMLIDREIEASLRLLYKSLQCRVKTSGPAESRWVPLSPLVSDVISTSGPPEIAIPHP